MKRYKNGLIFTIVIGLAQVILGIIGLTQTNSYSRRYGSLSFSRFFINKEFSIALLVLAIISIIACVIALVNLSYVKKGLAKFSKEIAITAGILGLIGGSLIGGIWILSGIRKQREEWENNSTRHLNRTSDDNWHSNKERSHKNQNRAWLSSEEDNDEMDGRRSFNEYDDLINNGGITKGKDIKNETMKQLYEYLLEIDYQHYTDLYIKSNPDWRLSQNKNIEKLADAIAYRHLIKLLTDQGFDTTTKGDINKFAEKLIFDEEQDYENIILVVIQQVEYELSKRR